MRREKLQFKPDCSGFFWKLLDPIFRINRAPVSLFIF